MNDLLITLGSLIGALGNTQSAATLRDHLGLVNTQLQLLKEHVERLEQENADLKQRNQALEQQLPSQLNHYQNSNPNRYCCDNCGSDNLTRTGNRADPTFGVLGMKQAVFTCNDCGTESAFTPN